MYPLLCRCRKLCFQSSNVVQRFLFNIPAGGAEGEKHTSHSTLPNSRKDGDFSDDLRSTWPRTEDEELPPCRGPLSLATPSPEVNELLVRLSSLQTWNPLPQDQSKAVGRKVSSEGARKATTWMNETGLKAPGAGFSLKSEKEKSKVFFNVRAVTSDRGTASAQTRFGGTLYWAPASRGGRRALEWRRAAKAGGRRSGTERAAGTATRRLHDERGRAEAGGGLGCRACPPAGLPLDSHGPGPGRSPSGPPRPPPARVRGTPSRGRAHAPHNPASRAHAAGPSRPTRAPSARTPAAYHPGLFWAARGSPGSRRQGARGRAA